MLYAWPISFLVLWCILLLLLLLLLLLSPFKSFISASADGLSWSLSEIKSPQVSRTVLSILSVLENVVVWMVSTRPPTSYSSNPFSNPLVTVPKAPITISVIFTCMFTVFFNSLAGSTYPSFHILSVLFCG